LIAALFVTRFGQTSLAAFALVPLAASVTLVFVSRWAVSRGFDRAKNPGGHKFNLTRRQVARAIFILFMLMFSKQIYSASISNYLTFYLINKFGVSVETSDIFLFLFLGAAALGTIAGGPIRDRIGRKWVIWISILGAAPFALYLPYAGYAATAVLVILIGFIMASSFSAILVFAQELVPGHAGAVAGLFFGLAFGLGGLGAAVLGKVADSAHGINLVYTICSFLPLIGILTVLLPSDAEKSVRKPA
jgi:FSR family fosmidomycin resistance protein-like MFS transporter